MKRRLRKCKTACPSGKLRHPDKLAARIALARLQNARGGRRVERRVYRCPACGGWHLTSQPRGAA